MGEANLIVRFPDGTERIFSLESEHSIGRLADNDIVLDDPEVSRRHAMIRRRDDENHVLIDLGSANGTLLNQSRIELPTPLRDGDEVEIAGFKMRFESNALEESDLSVPGLADRTANRGEPQKPLLLGISPAMVEIFRLIEQAARSPIPVLIEGETGTGKELVARSIHRTSRRAEQPFIAVNCAALSENILESELFGHRRGAFTGALQDKKGLFEAASGGSIFLDEIGEMPAGMQPKLLRVLQENEITPVGDTHPRSIDVRVISATNRDLAEQALEGAFRSDLYYRLAAFPIRIPPLRDRREDIPLIAERTLGTSAARHGRQLRNITPAALDALTRFDWPGNVRELQNEIDRAVAMAQNQRELDVAHLSERLRAGPGAPPSTGASTAGEPGAPSAPLRDARAAFEARYIAQVLAEQDGNVTRTARALGLSRFALQKKLKGYGLR